MAKVDFNSLPDTARVWVFASDRQLDTDEATVMLEEVDRFLADWKAHGAPLRCASDWREDRFLAIGVDPTAEQASGCSIDGLFRALKALEGSLATGLVGGGRVFYRDSKGQAQVAPRREVSVLFDRGVLTGETPVFDTSLTEAGAWRKQFERPARETWVASLLSPAHASQPSSRPATNSSSVRKG